MVHKYPNKEKKEKKNGSQKSAQASISTGREENLQRH